MINPHAIVYFAEPTSVDTRDGRVDHVSTVACSDYVIRDGTVLEMATEDGGMWADAHAVDRIERVDDA